MASSAMVRTYTRSRVIFYVIQFISFYLAIKFIPWIQENIIDMYLTSKITNNLLLEAAAFLIAFVAAVWILPEIGYLISDQIMD